MACCWAQEGGWGCSGMGRGVELWEWSRATIGVLKAHVPPLYISASFITAPLCAPHTCKAAFVMEKGAKRKKCQKGRWVEVGRDARRGRWNEKMVFINPYLFSERWLSVHALSPLHPVLYSHLHSLTPVSRPAFFWCLATKQLTRAIEG